jgi:phosphoribosyl 1,2-cyclic phosphodiesterase
MKIRFWGVRGSIASPGPKTVRYGGNTTCIEVRHRCGRAAES